MKTQLRDGGKMQKLIEDRILKGEAVALTANQMHLVPLAIDAGLDVYASAEPGRVKLTWANPAASKANRESVLRLASTQQL